MTPTIYLKFATMEDCEILLEAEGFMFSKYKDHIFKGMAFGAVFNIDETENVYVNIYDYEGTEFDNIKLPTPLTPYNQRA